MATFGAGCFWGVEHKFRKLPGVMETAVGYEGGHSADPTYEDVCTDETGHAEVVQLKFDPGKITYRQLLEAFFALHDPTQVNRQGPDAGSQYRTVIFTHSPEQAAEAKEFIQALEKSRRFSRPIATLVEPAVVFYRAEEYHQRYLEKKGVDSCGI